MPDLEEKSIRISRDIVEWLHDSGRNYVSLPEVILNDEENCHDYWDSMVPDRMSHSVMKATDCFQRKGFFMKLENRADPTEVVIFSYFQRYTNDNDFRLCECHPHQFFRWEKEYCITKHQVGSNEFKFLCSLCCKHWPPIAPTERFEDNLFLYLLLADIHPVCRLVPE